MANQVAGFLDSDIAKFLVEINREMTRARLKMLTSALYNAWSEVEHDILYKCDRHLAPLGRATEEQLKEELRNAMDSYLQPANDILESVARRARRTRGAQPRTARK